ncbi:MAG: hypothetical protein U5L73_11250 [Rhodoferax sp.]|uniref:hypothetical protein n=1 Tax=Rhodoferax sp. TaxID=50421 RepID=UPI002ACE5EC8|nr:hypothetical protein [Rhodoferax sp.]MDZ7892318.1 hypothetical protein [Rhodoferax sp.]
MSIQLSIALSQYIGKTLTLEDAKAIAKAVSATPDRSHDPRQFEPATYQRLTFQVERFADIEEEIHPLHVAHYAETEAYRAGVPMNPDYAHFRRCERDGGLLQFTARAQGELVGNIRMYLFNNLHTQTLSAKEDTFFMTPAVRKGFSAIRFWQYMERCLQQIGVQEITTDSKLVNQVGRLNTYLGYTHVANVFHKFLRS